MLLGARQYMSGGWRNPYVTDGLIAMWDGEWNSGPGKHDASATVWKDLVGDCDAQTGTGQVGDNYMLEGSSYAERRLTYADKINFSSLSHLTLESCITQMTDTTGYHMIIGSNTDRFSLSHPTKDGTELSWRVSNTGSRPRAYGRNGTIVAVYDNGRATLWRNGTSGSGVSVAKEWSNTMYLTWCNSWGYKRGSKRVHCYRLYNRALTSVEIAANHAVDKERFGLP